MEYQFGEFVLDTRLRELRRGDTLVSLQPKSFDALGFFIRERQRVVTRDDLLAELWPGETVTPAAINVCVNAVRKALGDTGDQQKLIRTYRGRGYRFVGAVEVRGEERNEGRSTDVREMFVGRHPELTNLKNALDQTILSGRGRVVLVSGAAGIGKTRLVEELAHYSGKRRVPTLTGRCVESDGAPPFWPWAQVLRQYIGLADDMVLRNVLGSGAPELVQLAPTLRERLPRLMTPVRSDEFARLRLFAAMSRFLSRAARRRGLLVVLDDLQWADESSLLVLRELLGELDDAPLLIVATARADEVERTDALSSTLEVVHRNARSETVSLDGLPVAEVRELLTRIVAEDVPDHFVQTIRDGTAGNPFFIIETVRHLAERSQEEDQPNYWSMALSTRQLIEPEGVRELIWRRISRLGPSARDALSAAAIVGREFDFHTLREASVANEDLVTSLDSAYRAKLIEEVRDEEGRYVFAHALTREALLDELGWARRSRLHCQVGDALERILEKRGSSDFSDLAKHYYWGTRAGGDERRIDKAIRYCGLAALSATQALAYEDAAQHLNRALELRLEYRSKQKGELCDLLLELMEAQSQAGDSAAAQVTAREAAAIARVLGTPDRLAIAALGGDGGMVHRLVDSQSQVALMEEALAALEQSEPRLRSLLLSRIALAITYRGGTRQKQLDLASEAERLARHISDDQALYWALVSRHVALFGPTSGVEQLGIVEEMLHLAERMNAGGLLVRARSYRIGALFHRTRVSEAKREIEEVAALADEVCSPLFQWTAVCFRASQAQIEGRFTEAEHLSRQALDSGLSKDDAFLVYVSQTGAQRYSQWRLPELESLIEGLIDRHPFPLLRAVYAECARQRGDQQAARARLATLTEEGLQSVTEDNLWLGTMSLLAMVAHYADDREQATKLYTMLEPYADGTIVVGNAAACIGAVGRPLGVLAELVRDQAACDRHFERAMECEHEAGMHPWLAHTQFEYAGVLMKRDRATDQLRAEKLLLNALATAQELEMPEFAQVVKARSDKLANKGSGRARSGAVG